MNSALTIEPIATFKSPFSTKFGIPRQSGLAGHLKGEIHFEGPFRNPDVLRGLESFRYLWLIWGFTNSKWANKSAEQPGKCPLPRPSNSDFRATVRPPRLGGNVAMGVFATRSPFRPNPLGLSSVRIASVDLQNMIIHTLGADLMDGTPIYDVKPYLEYADSHVGAGNGFVDASPWQELAVEFTPRAEDDLRHGACPLDDGDLEGLQAALRLDPRPHYRPDNPNKSYGFIFRGHDVRFSVSNGVLTVLEAPLV